MKSMPDGGQRKFRLGNCFTPYQRLWLYNGAPLVAFYDTLGIRRTYSRLKPPACSRGGGGQRKKTSKLTLVRSESSRSPTLIRRLKHSVNTSHESIFSDPDIVRELSRLHENSVIVPTDKASNNYTFVCKRYYVSILTEELELKSLPWNPTYNLMDFSAPEVLDNHESVLTSFGIETSDDELDLPYIYWIPKMHKN